MSIVHVYSNLKHFIIATIHATFSIQNPQNDPIWIFQFAFVVLFTIFHLSFAIANNKSAFAEQYIFEWILVVDSLDSNLWWISNCVVNKWTKSNSLMLKSKHKYRANGVRVARMWPRTMLNNGWEEIFTVLVHRFFLFSFISIIIILHFRLFNIIISYKIDNNNKNTIVHIKYNP